MGTRQTDEGDTMKYMLLICAEPNVVVDESKIPDIDVWLSETGTRRLDGNQLEGVSQASTVRVRDGERLVTDGPFAETKEQIAGFDVIDCDSMQEALEIAARHPVAHFGSVEVRPFWTDPV
jgi:hypothetical protein